MDGLVGIIAIILGGIWAIAAFVVGIWYLVALFKADWVIALISLFIAPVAIIILLKHWPEVKRPFLANLAVILIGVMGIFGFIALQASMATAQDPPPAIPDVTNFPEFEEPDTIEETPTTPEPPAPRDNATPILDRAFLTVPPSWTSAPWELPNLGLAMGDPTRGEYVTVHLVEKSPDLSFEQFQEAALADVRQHIVNGGDTTAPSSRSLPAGPVTAVGLSGIAILPDQSGKPISLRVACVDARHHYFSIVQWRTAAWDAESIEIFDHILHSLEELQLPEQPNP